MLLHRGRCKRVVLAVLCLMVMASPAAAALTFDAVNLTYWVGVDPAWVTYSGFTTPNALGVSAAPDGTQMSSGGALTPLLQSGNVYYLYAGKSVDIQAGQNVTVYLYTDYIGQGGGSPRLTAGSYVVGTPGTFQLWDLHVYGADNPTPTVPPTNPVLDPTPIYLGWAKGTADKVGFGWPNGNPNPFAPDGAEDYYLVMGIGVQPTPPSTVPIPGALLLFGSGVLGLVGIGRRGRKKS